LKICVHSNTQMELVELARILQETSFAYEGLVSTLGWPKPLSDGSFGGNKALDFYLVPHLANEVSVSADAPSLDLDHDAASAFVRLDPSLPSACYRPFRIAQAVARAGIYAVDASANDAFANAVATSLAHDLVPCAAAEWSAIDDEQATPEQAITAIGKGLSRSSFLFPTFLQTKYGEPASVDLLHAIFVVSSGRTSPGLDRYRDEPDAFDVLRKLGKDRDSSLSEMLLEYGISRAFLGNRDDGLRSYDSSSLGRFGRIRFDWSIPYKSLPRSLSPRGAIDPTGAVYLWVDLKDRPKDSGLGLRVQWEDTAIYRFAILQIGADGSEVARTVPVTLDRSTGVEANVEHMEQAVGAIVVGVNVGALDREFEFDPDEIPYTPTNCVVSLFPIN
jgi:hypothetical protein